MLRLNIALTTIWFNLKRNNSLLAIVFLVLLFKENVFAEVQDKLQQNLSFNNHYLDINYRKELFSFVMIYYYQLKYSKSVSLFDSLVILVANSQKIPLVEAKRNVAKILSNTDNPIKFYKAIQKLNHYGLKVHRFHIADYKGRYLVTTTTFKLLVCYQLNCNYNSNFSICTLNIRTNTPPSYK